MKKTLFCLFLTVFILAADSHAYWVWTPESGTWTNPKYAVKDTPKEQYDWAMSFFDTKDYKKGIAEFKKLVSSFPNSEYAPKSQYYVGRCFEELGNYYDAFTAYQQVIDKYPYTEKTDEIIEREYRIGNLFFSGQKDKILGVPIMPSLDKAVEIYTKVVSNAPYSQFADKAQFQLGLTHEKLQTYSEAVKAFKKLIDQYPKSELLEQAKYELAYSTSKASLAPGYDQRSTDEAIEVFENVANQAGQSEEVVKTLSSLKEKKANSLYDTAKFYEKQKHYDSAFIYYKNIIDKYPETSIANAAAKKLEYIKDKLKR